ncbi:MAG: sensor histidine kinase, partial [Pseudomonadota bacterium]
DWPELVASRDEMVRLFQNIVGNALKYVPADTRPAITVTSQATPDDWKVWITDNGVGVDPAQTDRLFQVFSRLHTREEYEGSGIGLALCRRIVEHHGGTIGVESDGPGCGSTFWFRIPRAGREAVEDE